MTIVQGLIHWFTQHPLGSVSMLFATGILSVLVYSYFEPREEG